MLISNELYLNVMNSKCNEQQFMIMRGLENASWFNYSSHKDTQLIMYTNTGKWIYKQQGQYILPYNMPNIGLF